MRAQRLIMIAVVLGLLSLAGCVGSVSVGVPIGSPYGGYPYGPSHYGPHRPYGPYGTVRVGTGPIIW